MVIFQQRLNLQHQAFDQVAGQRRPFQPQRVVLAVAGAANGDAAAGAGWSGRRSSHIRPAATAAAALRRSRGRRLLAPSSGSISDHPRPRLRAALGQRLCAAAFGARAQRRRQPQPALLGQCPGNSSTSPSSSKISANERTLTALPSSRWRKAGSPRPRYWRRRPDWRR